MKPVTVSALNTHIVTLFEHDELLRDIWVLGEISNWKRAASGHIYFSLKDDGAAIGAVMWKNVALSQSWLPNEGDQIVAHGYVGVYPERGTFQLYVNQILPFGRGQLYEELERLKARLAAAGLFDAERKRPIPLAPTRLAVVTSRDAAALRDILRVLAGRWPLVEVVLFSTLVQGVEAPAQLVAALATANDYARTVSPIDTLILARGGGSIEDLWAFNSEALANAIVESHIPVITGIGHETDFTIADFVADLRAPTPSAAAAAAVPDRAEVAVQLAGLQRRLVSDAAALLAGARADVAQALQRVLRLDPRRQIDLRRQRLEDRTVRMEFALRRKLDRLAAHSQAARQRLVALSPVAVLQRGYSVVQKEDGAVVSDPAQTTAGERLHIRTAGGAYTATRT
ncbi:MAG: exodeoxyribonuclease VII large subunit [Chloroflexi bacterium]|nr:MAG: exodeoxyribonuclease VII large subunit [Chloroflexota bacterium]